MCHFPSLRASFCPPRPLFSLASRATLDISCVGADFYPATSSVYVHTSLFGVAKPSGHQYGCFAGDCKVLQNNLLILILHQSEIVFDPNLIYMPSDNKAHEHNCSIPSYTIITRLSNLNAASLSALPALSASFLNGVES